MQRGPWQGSQLLGRSRRPIVAALMASALVLSACGGGGGNKGGGDDSLPITKPNNVTNDPVRDGGTVTMALEKDVPNFNSISGDGVSLEGQMVVNGIFPTTFVQQPDFTVKINNDLLDSASVTKSSPQTVVYKIKPSASWSDGTPISADDFIYNWQTQNGTDPGYSAASSTGYEDIDSVKGSDGGKTVTVTYSHPFADWQSLFGTLLPAHVMKSLGDPHKTFNE